MKYIDFFIIFTVTLLIGHFLMRGGINNQQILIVPANDPLQKNVVLVELFTSASCSSCPPADLYANELAKNSSVLVLTYHVDYWDYLNWKDEYSLADASQKQRWYASKNGFGTYTPQIIVGGASEAVGSNYKLINQQIEAALSVNLKTILLVKKTTNKNINISFDEEIKKNQIILSIVSFTPKLIQNIKNGENAGKIIEYSNVVKSIRYYEIANLNFDIELMGDELLSTNKVVLLIQNKNNGKIIDFKLLE